MHRCTPGTALTLSVHRRDCTHNACGLTLSTLSMTGSTGRHGDVRHADAYQSVARWQLHRGATAQERRPQPLLLTGPCLPDAQPGYEGPPAGAASTHCRCALACNPRLAHGVSAIPHKQGERSRVGTRFLLQAPEPAHISGVSHHECAHICRPTPYVKISLTYM
jgi:hypothetical protein